jgi:hypothetical protein
MKNLVLRFLNDDSGATAIEYGLIAAGHLNRDHRCREYNWLEPEHDVHQHFQPAKVKAHTRSAKTKAPAIRPGLSFPFHHKPPERRRIHIPPECGGGQTKTPASR